MKKTFSGTILAGLLVSGSFGSAAGQGLSQPLDNFNRSNSVVVGASSASNTQAWSETETTGSNDFRARIENNMLVLSSHNDFNTGSNGMEQVSFDVEGRYATIFNQAAGNLEWSFNFRQTRVNSSGFGANTYGLAYVLGCNQAVFNQPGASGYAVVIGNSGTPDPIRLVRFNNGLTANSNVTNIITTTENAETAFFSVKVTYDPCARTWSLQVRNDGTTGFDDPATVTEAPLTASDQTFTNTNLNFTGAAYNHGTAREFAQFDNISVPAAGAAATVYSWTGAVSSDFLEPGNWRPARHCNRTTDILNFNSGGLNSIANVSSQTVSSFSVTNNTVLTLKGRTGTQTLTIFDGEKEDLFIEAGSSLIIDSNDPLVISLQAGATGKVAGTFTFQNTAMNLGRVHRLLATDPGAVIFEPGSFLFARHLSGEPFSNAGAANAFIFRSGSAYISRAGASPFGLASPNSKVVFETGSLYRHEQTGVAPSFTGRTYADFELNVTANLAIIFGTSSATPNRIDNFTISSGNMNVTLSNGTNPLPLQIAGNLTIAPGALLNFSPTQAASASPIIMNGTGPQTISGAITWGVNSVLEISNPAGVTLKTPQALAGRLQLSDGLLHLDAGASLTFEDNALATGGSKHSYVDGRIIKIGDDAFTFPTGKEGFYAPVAISAPLLETDVFSAEYFPVNPALLYGALKNDSLTEISRTEYWDVERISGTSEVKVSLSYDPARSLVVARPEDLRIAHFKGPEGWSIEGMVLAMPLAEVTMMSTVNEQASFSPFTFASVGSYSVLPVELTTFSGKAAGTSINLTWETLSERNSYRFEVQRSADGQRFETIGTVKAAGTSSQLKRYVFSDENPGAGLKYYRLKQLDRDNTFAFSKVIAISPEKGVSDIRLYPNPATTVLTVALPSGAVAGTIQIITLTGQTVRTINATANEVKVPLPDLPAGTYQVKIKNEQDTQVRRFVKVN